MDQHSAHPHRLLHLWALAALCALLLAGCGGGRSVVAPVEELSERSRASAPVVSSGITSAEVHRVRSGETLYSIAFLHGLDFQRVARWNGIRAPYLIRVGQRLRLTPPKGAKAPPPGPVSSAKRPDRAPAKSTGKAPPAPKRVTKAPAKAKAHVKPTSSKPAPKPAAKRPKSPSKWSWRWPTKGKLLKTFSSRKPGRKGIDIGGRKGQPVVAAGPGEVVYSGNGLQRYYGKLIIIKHNDRFLSAYAHNERLLVKEGQWVKGGERIAALGDSGTDRAKLHFEIRRDGKPVNPLKYLPKRR